jgi:uroporphyrinogen decarboxylase
MHPPTFQQLVLNSARRLALPISTYPALWITGAKVSDIVTNPRAQFEAQSALRKRFGSPFALAAMDLSAEAEAFGCTVAISDAEIPTVTGRLVTNIEQAKALAVPQPGDKRTSVYIEAVQLLRSLEGEPFVFGGCIGPFSLAARLVGVSEALELTLAEPELMHVLLERSSQFLAGYINAFRAAGARGVIMAEPAAGLLSPRGMSKFSSAYIRQVFAELNDPSFTLLLHNCGAKLLHLPAILETGLNTFHFGAPMDLVGALKQVPPDTIICGNLDPAGVFVQSSPAEVAKRTAQLLSDTAALRNYVISSGCDVPPNAPLTNLEAFYQAVHAANAPAHP